MIILYFLCVLVTAGCVAEAAPEPAESGVSSLSLSAASFREAGVTWNPVRAYPNNVTGQMFAPLSLLAGQTLKGVRVNFIGDPSMVPFQFSIIRTRASGADVSVVTANFSQGPTWRSHELTTPAESPLLDTDSYTLRVFSFSTGYTGNVVVRYAP